MGVSQEWLDQFKTKLKADGMVLDGEGVVSEIAQKLIFKMWFVGGMMAHDATTPGQYVLHLRRDYDQFTPDQWQTGLPQIDPRIEYVSHQPQSTRCLVYIRINE